MLEFRNQCPQRRDIKKVVASHTAHRKDLRIDFYQRCGYCNDWDLYKTTYYEIDHFVPEDVMTTMSNTEYSNLVYACRSCNNAKRANWPSGREDVAIVGDTGFIDPCDKSHSDQFERETDGSIKAKTELGKWMYVALKLSKPQHKLIYQLEKLDQLIEKVEVEIKGKPELEGLLLNPLRMFHAFQKQLREV